MYEFTLDRRCFFLKTYIKSENPKQISLHKIISERNIKAFFADLSTANWFVMDYRNCNHYEVLYKASPGPLYNKRPFLIHSEYYYIIRELA
ncbi:hypothetical protein NQ315_017191 [Exocentrus adspersus]|uniref:Uncharacterized protein n=1 Tax=Exocentrus adspersus TaxID=1586481 RepID=A0AAV8VHJ9_9CUCU|nr:hypothetical protein NQ315_017191 [Exocentrus adspersus]